MPHASMKPQVYVSATVATLVLFVAAPIAARIVPPETGDDIKPAVLLPTILLPSDGSLVEASGTGASATSFEPNCARRAGKVVVPTQCRTGFQVEAR
jgi:hypothetical protein